MSYTIGVYSGKNLKQQSVDIDPDIMMKGIKDSLSGGKTLLTDQEMQEVMTVFQKDMTAKQAENRKTVGEQNKKEGETFLAENKKKEGVKTLPNGLQYKVITEGTGKSPKATDIGCRPLPGHPDRRNRIRQFIPAERTGHFQVG